MGAYLGWVVGSTVGCMLMLAHSCTGEERRAHEGSKTGATVLGWKTGR